MPQKTLIPKPLGPICPQTTLHLYS
jgi:hypothetical protein